MNPELTPGMYPHVRFVRGGAYSAYLDIGPLREGDLSEPLRDSDFCDCPRGREALRWRREGLVVLPQLAELAGDCDACEPATGRRYYRGYYTPEGTAILLGKHLVGPDPRPSGMGIPQLPSPHAPARGTPT